jgi:HK97 family phage portal protein
MKVVEKVAGLFGYQKRSGASNPSQWLIDWVNGGAEVSSGATVNENIALKYTPFWAAVRVISGTISALPFLVYKRTDDGKERINTHPIYKLLHDRPNEYMDAITFIESRQAHVLTYGNGYAEIQRDGGGRPVALWPLLPNRTERKIDKAGTPYYEVRLPTGGAVNLPDANVLHVKGLGFDGYSGYNVVQYHKEAIGYGIAVKEFGARFFGNGANAQGILEHPENLSKPAQDRLRESFEKDNQGLSKAHRLMILEEGMKWSKTGIDPEQAQALETQKYTVDDCSRIFNIPPHKLASMERATFSNIEEQNLEFITQTMLYWFRKWEQECNYKLLMPSEQSSLFCEILVDGLLRGNIAARSTSYATGRQWGYYSINDIRRMENLNPIGPEGDLYLDPLNMKPAGAVTPVAPVAPTPKDDTKPDQKPPEEKDNNRDNVTRAFVELLETQWGRAIHKQINALQKPIKDDFYKGHRDWTYQLLIAAVNAYASIRGVNNDKAQAILTDVIERNINKDIKLNPLDTARLTESIIKQIGDSKNGRN